MREDYDTTKLVVTLIIFALFLMLVSCNKTLSSYMDLRYESDADLLPHAQVFYAAHPNRGRTDSVMYWANTLEPHTENKLTIAICLRTVPPQIILHSGKINRNDSVYVKTVLWHELGHCALGLEHTAYPQDGIQLMMPYIHDALLLNPNFYMEQL